MVPMLTRILAESDPFGEDHQTVLDTSGCRPATRRRPCDPGCGHPPAPEEVLRAKKTRALKLAAVQALLGIGSSRARSALDEAGRSGDRMLKNAVREARGVA